MLTIIQILLILSLLSFQSGDAKCSPSACGIIGNISYPFHLKGDPNHCGDSIFELDCEDNVTFFYQNSHKYFVKDIIYGTGINYELTVSMRVVDASINNGSICSFPTYSFIFDLFIVNSFGLSPWPIHFMSCPNPLSNSSNFTNVTDCASNSSLSTPRYNYIKVDSLQASELQQGCSVDVVALTSWRFRNIRNVSLSEIHHSLLYGFDLYPCDQLSRRCSKTPTKWENFKNLFSGINGLFFLIPLAILVFLVAGVSIPVTIIIGITGLLLLSFTSLQGTFSYKADVYSFGMLLMEMVSLKRDSMGNNGDSDQYFPYWIYDHINQGKDIVSDLDDNMREVARKMIIVALWCIQMRPDDRPSMNKVLEMLEANVEHLQIPDYPSQSTQSVVNADLSEDDVASSLEITVQ